MSADNGSLPPERLKYASGLFNMMRNPGGAVGIAILRHPECTEMQIIPALR
jgi:hypothetical protein